MGVGQGIIMGDGPAWVGVTCLYLTVRYNFRGNTFGRVFRTLCVTYTLETLLGACCGRTRDPSGYTHSHGHDGP